VSSAAGPAAEQIAQRGLQELRRRLRTAIEHEAARPGTGVHLQPAQLDELVSRAAQRAGAALWRRSLAQAGSEIMGIPLAQAITHPAVRRAHEIVGAPPFEPGTRPEASATPPPPATPPPSPTPTRAPAPPPQPVPARAPSPTPPAPSPEAIRVEAVHMAGIESLRTGERDLEVRFSDEGIDVLKRSSGAVIGDLRWTEINDVQTRRNRHGLRRVLELHVDTARGRASFELPGLAEDQLTEHLTPLLERHRDASG
jgi:predicted component of type VI protein secretion system